MSVMFSQIDMILSSILQMTVSVNGELLQGVSQSHSVIKTEPHLSFIWFVLFQLSNC